MVKAQQILPESWRNRPLTVVESGESICNASCNLWYCKTIATIHYKRDVILFFQLNDLLAIRGGVKLSPNISLWACPWCEKSISFAMMVALLVIWSIFSGSLHNRWMSCNLLSLEFTPIPHSLYILLLSSSVYLLYISLLSISLSRRRAFLLSFREK